MMDGSRLQIGQVITNEDPSMVRESEALIQSIGGGLESIGRAQFESLMKNAVKASSFEALLLFISYQESKRHGWDWIGRDSKSAAVHVIESLKKVVSQAMEKIEPLIAQEDVDARNDQERAIKLQIAEKYLGYLYWQATVSK